MRTIQRLAQKWSAAAAAVALVSLATSAMAQGQPTILNAKVIRVIGAARYSVDGKTWQTLHKGDILKAGAVVQTAEKSTVDLMLGEREASAAPAAAPVVNGTLYSPEEATANIVRLKESTVMGIDKLTTMQTGVDAVEETQLDLKTGTIMGNVKKLSSASKYEVKLPNGVAGIRGTMYIISSSGIVNVLEGSVVIAVVGSDGTVVTKVITAGYKYDPMTGTLAQIPENDIIKLRQDFPTYQPPPQVIQHPGPIIFISPNGNQNGQGQNGNGQGGQGNQGGNGQGP